MEVAYLLGKHVAGLMIKGCLLNIHVNVNLKLPAAPFGVTLISPRTVPPRGRKTTMKKANKQQ